MKEVVKNKLKEHIGGRGDTYATEIAERLKAEGILNTKGKEYNSAHIRKVFTKSLNHPVITPELVKLFKERKRAADKLLKSIGLETKKTEAGTSVSN